MSYSSIRTHHAFQTVSESNKKYKNDRIKKTTNNNFNNGYTIYVFFLLFIQKKDTMPA